MNAPEAAAGPVLEHAFIYVNEPDATAFEAAFAEARKVIAAAPGFRWVELHRGVERPGVHLLLVGWDSLDDHVAGFRGSARFTRWRELIGPFFTADTDVEHFTAVADRFAG
jgi:heme-degrading monooxygenase HmoA